MASQSNAVRVIVCGACGRMGGRILDLASKNPGIVIAGALETKGHPGVGKPAPFSEVTVTDDLKSLEGKADVLIDFTSPEATLEHLKMIQNWKIAAVVGTTGIGAADAVHIDQAAKKIPVVFSFNMSVGINLMLDLVRKAAKQLASYDIEIIEAHHNQKKDAPSGTALMLAKEIAGELERNLEKDLVNGRHGTVGPRKPKEIGMHAVRAGDIFGDHTVLFATAGERLEITHKASSRDVFAGGALRAALWLKDRKPGLYTMRDVLASE